MWPRIRGSSHPLGSCRSRLPRPRGSGLQSLHRRPTSRLSAGPCEALRLCSSAPPRFAPFESDNRSRWKLDELSGPEIDHVKSLEDLSPSVAPDAIRGIGDHIPEIIDINEIEAAPGGMDEQSAPEIFWLELFVDRGADADSPCLPVLVDVDSPWLIQPAAKPNHAGLVRLLHFELAELAALRSAGPIPLGIRRGALYPQT